MDLLIARGVALRRAPEAPDHVVSGVDLRLGAGSRIGLVGPGTTETSAVLRLLAGAVTPSSGRVVAAPGVSVAYLQRDAALNLPDDRTVWQVAAHALEGVDRLGDMVGEAAAAMASAAPERRHAATAAYEALLVEYRRRGGPGAPALVRQGLAALGLGLTRHATLVASLPYGDRQRLALAAVLASGADVVLLDEPTNGLELTTRLWLERHLSRRHGALLVVSNDRAFLDAATDRTAFLDETGLKVVRAAYTKAAKADPRRDSRTAKRLREMEQQAQRREKLADELAAIGARRRSTSNATRPAPVPAPGRRVRHGAVLLRAERLSLAGAFTDVRVQIAAGDRIALLGSGEDGTNGLLTLVTGERQGDDPEQRLWYAPAMHLVSVDRRTRGLEPGVAVIEQGSAWIGPQPARRALAASGLPYSQWSQPPELLAPVDRARAGIALALARPCHLLVLEEPTLDLDLAAVEELEARLQNWSSRPGTALLIATHDRQLARSVADRAWSVSDDRLVAYSSVRAYLRGDDGVLPEAFWDEDLEPQPEAATDASEPMDSGSTRDSLETERARLLDLLSDPLALAERELERANQRLEELEAALMADYDASLSPTAPRYRVIENGLTLYADVLEPAETDRARPDPGRLLLVATTDEQEAATAMRSPEPRVPWLDVRTADGIAHLRLGTLPGSSLLPGTVVALVNAGVYLAFTVLGARSVQLFSRDDLSSTRLSDAGDGWWRMSLARFLKLEGWSGRDARRDRDRDAHRARGRRKAVET